MASELSTEHLIRPNECAQGGTRTPTPCGTRSLV